ncbi:MAG: hypothetical protein ABSA50_11930 [Candidatus Bathyarchaeia archaeon]
MGNPMHQSVPQQADPVQVLHTFEVQLNAHNVNAALALFTDNAVVYDPTTISCYGGTGSSCEPGNIIISYTSKTQIRGWLQYLAQVDIEVKEAGVPQIAGSNVTWTWQVSNNGYRTLNIAPLVGAGEAILQGNLIKYFSFRLSADSIGKLTAALAASSRSPYSVAGVSIAFSLVALGMVFPGVAVYYVSRVKRLFASVPKLDKPWILLGAGVGVLFVSVLLVALREVAAISTSVADPLFDVILAVCAFFVMSAMILMKRVMISEPDE